MRAASLEGDLARRINNKCWSFPGVALGSPVSSNTFFLVIPFTRMALIIIHPSTRPSIPSD